MHVVGLNKICRKEEQELERKVEKGGKEKGRKEGRQERKKEATDKLVTSRRAVSHCCIRVIRTDVPFILQHQVQMTSL